MAHLTDHKALVFVLKGGSTRPKREAQRVIGNKFLQNGLTKPSDLSVDIF